MNKYTLQKLAYFNNQRKNISSDIITNILESKDQKIRKYPNNIDINLIPKNYDNNLKKYIITTDDKLTLNNFTKLNSIDDINIEDITNNLFFLFFESDDEYLYPIEKIYKYNGKLIIYPDGRKYNYVHSSKNCKLTLEKTLKRINDISHYDEIIHGNICQALEQTKNLDGAYVEIGVYKGGSALTALNYMNNSNIFRKSYFLDTYDGFNYAEADTSCDFFWNKSHKLWGPDETIDKISNMLKDECPNSDFKLIKSNICSDNLPSEIDKIVVANIDVDMLEATVAAFEKVADKIVDGGIIIAEDPTSTPGLIGAFYAMEKFLLTDVGKKFMKLHLIGQYFLIKIR
jgi:hypothetical protein